MSTAYEATINFDSNDPSSSKEIDLHFDEFEAIELEVNKKSKNSLLSKLEDIYSKYTRIEEQEKKIDNPSIKKKLSKIIKDLSEEKSEIKNRITIISTIDKITKKFYYTPLEAALLSNNNELFLAQLNSPSLYEKSKFYFVPSFTFHALKNHTEFRFNFISTDQVYFKNNHLEAIINGPNFNIGSRLLPLSSSVVMITGGWTRDYELPFDEETLMPLNNCLLLFPWNSEANYKNIKPLIEARYWHAMTFIDGYPAVLCGKNSISTIDSECNINSVEIYCNEEWKYHSNTIEKRVSPGTINHDSKVWLFGGFIDKRLDSIEIYENKTWLLLNIKLPEPLSSMAVICIGINRVLILGGLDKEEKTTKNCYLFNSKEFKFKKIKDLDEPMKFSHGGYNLGENNEIKLLGYDKDCRNKEISYLYKIIIEDKVNIEDIINNDERVNIEDKVILKDEPNLLKLWKSFVLEAISI